jgi:hypothetical protein
VSGHHDMIIHYVYCFSNLTTYNSVVTEQKTHASCVDLLASIIRTHVLQGRQGLDMPSVVKQGNNSTRGRGSLNIPTESHSTPPPRIGA